jgi:hypothetical protein
LSYACHVNIVCKTCRERAKQHQDVPGPAAVKTQRPITSEQEHRVLEFRPRSSLRPQGRQGYPRGQVEPEDGPEPNDLSRYERPRDESDDFRHRMLANVAAIAFTVALMAIGIWLAVSIADMRKTQDCVLMGRRDCARIYAPQG